MSLISAETSGEGNDADSLIFNGFNFLKALAKEGVAHKVFFSENFMETAIAVVSLHGSQTYTEQDRQDAACQEIALEAILEFLKRSSFAAEQVCAQNTLRN